MASNHTPRGPGHFPAEFMVRPAIAKDINSILALDLHCWPYRAEIPSDTKVNRAMEVENELAICVADQTAPSEIRSGHTLVLEVNGRAVVGRICVDMSTQIPTTRVTAGDVREAWIECICVQEVWRMRGYGRALLQAALDYLQANNCGIVSLCVANTPSTYHARRLYRSFGFSQIVPFPVERTRSAPKSLDFDGKPFLHYSIILQV
jgi:ribosomal protein S18 acetylase RimI-like enzyme